jgi:NAD(P)-dependent dehydrogenase (short-subunit alcohol dehydrogenase family)
MGSTRSTEARWAVVTGGAQGIGRAIVEHLEAGGWEVVAVDRDAEALQDLPPTVHGLTLDVADDALPGRLAGFLRPLTDHLELLVNNAGIMATEEPGLAALPAFDRVLAVNLRAPYVVVATLLPWLRRGRHPAIINIASTRALMSEPHTEGYAASKGGLVALTHALAVSLGPTIRVNAISPGWIATEAWQKPSRRTTPALTEADHLQHPAGRVGTPEDVARAVLFLADPDNTFITGANLVVDGGMTRKMIYLDT